MLPLIKTFLVYVILYLAVVACCHQVVAVLRLLLVVGRLAFRLGAYHVVVALVCAADLAPSYVLRFL